MQANLHCGAKLATSPQEFRSTEAKLPISRQIQIGLIALATMNCTAGLQARAQSANSRVITNAEGVQVPTEAFEKELTCIYEAAGWDATMNFAENAYLRRDNNTLRDSIAEEIADCARQHNWDAETQTLAFNTFLHSAVMDYSIEETGSAQFDSTVIFEIWGDLSNDDKAALVADDAGKNAALLARTAAAIRARVPSASDQSVAYVQIALAAATVYSNLRYQWSQKSVGK